MGGVVKRLPLWSVITQRDHLSFARERGLWANRRLFHIRSANWMSGWMDLMVVTGDWWWEKYCLGNWQPQIIVSLSASVVGHLSCSPASWLPLLSINPMEFSIHLDNYLLSRCDAIRRWLRMGRWLWLWRLFGTLPNAFLIIIITRTGFPGNSSATSEFILSNQTGALATRTPPKSV